MEIAFDTRELRLLCEKNEPPVSLASTVVESLRSRLADVRAALTVHDLVAGAPNAGGDHGEILVIQLADGYELILHANHVNNPVAVDGKVDWSNVSRVKVIAVESVSG